MPTFFAILEKYERQGACLAAYSKGASDKNSARGIVQGHAYSILCAKYAGGMCFVQALDSLSPTHAPIRTAAAAATLVLLV